MVTDQFWCEFAIWSGYGQQSTAGKGFRGSAFINVNVGGVGADYRIVGLIRKGDILITQDYGLASLVLPKRVRVFHQTGKEFSATTIDSLLEQRYQSGRLRKAGLRTRGPKPFTTQDHQNFRQALIQALEQVKLSSNNE